MEYWLRAGYMFSKFICNIYSTFRVHDLLVILVILEEKKETESKA